MIQCFFCLFCAAAFRKHVTFLLLVGDEPTAFDHTISLHMVIQLLRDLENWFLDLLLLPNLVNVVNVSVGFIQLLVLSSIMIL